MLLENYTIYPTQKHNRPAPPSKIYLHGLDGLSAAIQIRNHRFYRPTTEFAFSDIIEKLKDSLAEALELYLPMTGNIEPDDQNRLYISLKSVKGTPFEVQEKETPFVRDTPDLAARLDPVLPDNASIFAVKVTKFSCGTILIASSFNHQAGDLRACLDFIELWSLLMRNEPVDFNKIPADWTRTPDRFFTNVEKLNDNSAPAPFTLLPEPGLPPAHLLVPSTLTNWKFTPDGLKQLKKDLTPADSNQWISSGDALSALLSSAITRARHAAQIPRLDGRCSEASNQENIVMAADGRERSPQKAMVNGQYFGNFNPLYQATASRQDLESTSPEAISRVAVAIRNGLNQLLSPEAIKYKIAFFENPEHTQPPGRIMFTGDVILTNWTRNDMQSKAYDIGWGKPFLTTSGSGGVFPPGYCLMTQNSDTGDLFSLVTIETEAAEKLKSDVMLNKYATIIPEE